MYYSSNYLYEFYNRTIAAIKSLHVSYEFILVDDGSPDDSLHVAKQLQQQDANIIIVELSRNFGHQRAIMTGLQQAEGDYVFLIDCDLEEDPSLLTKFWERFQSDSDIDVIYGIQEQRKGGWFERVSGRLFYLLISKLSKVSYPTDTLTARLMTRRYVEVIKSFSETELDLWGIFAIAGFRQESYKTIKSHKGTSTFTISKKISHAIEIVSSFTHRPLYLTFGFGMICFLVALANVGAIIYKKFFLQVDVEGWASILASVWLIGGMIFLVLGIFGIYLSKMFLEIKRRPLTIVKKLHKRTV
jgi:putative glycosyltransferase